MTVKLLNPVGETAAGDTRDALNLTSVLAWIFGAHLLFWALVLLVRPPFPDPVFLETRIRSLAVAGGQKDAKTPPRRTYLLATGPDATFTATVEVTDPEQGLLVFAPRYNRHATLHVNGQPVPSLDPSSWRAGRMGGRWLVPPANLQAGANRLSIHVTRECCRAYLASLHAAPPEVLAGAVRDWRTQKLVPSLAAAILGSFGALVCLYLAFTIARRDFALAAAMALGGISLGALWQVDIFTASSEPLYNAAGQALLALTLSGLILLSDRWFGVSPRFDLPLRIIAPLTLVLIALGMLGADGMPPLWRTALEAAMALGASFAIITHVVRALRRDARRWASDAAIFLLVPTISLADLMGSLYRDPLTLTAGPLGLLALAMLLLIGIVRRGRLLFAQAEEANTYLAARIAAKERELEETSALLRKREAEAAVQAERARIMRDMHDGMGGHLLSVLMLARDDHTPRRAIAETTENAIDDLRLLIDSLDSVGDSLDIALGQFRDRAETKLRAAGIALAWENRLGRGTITDAPSIEAPGKVLTVYRILQEAVNNAVRHSACTLLRITIEHDEAGQTCLTIADNGMGDRAAWFPGRGLANMAERACTIGASLKVDATANGTTLRLTVPEN